MSTDTVTLDKPSGTIDGELLIAFVSGTGGTLSATLNTVPSGWTLINGDSGDGRNLYAYYKIASSEPSSWNWVWSTSLNLAGSVLRISDFSSASPIDTSSVSSHTGSPSLVFTNAITPSSGDGLLLFGLCANNTSNVGATGYAIATNNPSWTERADIANGTSQVFALASAQRPQTTSTGNASATVSGGGTTDARGILVYVNLERNANGNHAILTSPHEIFPTSISVGTTSSHTILTSPHEIFINRGKISIDNDLRWSSQEKGSKNWTDQTK